MQSLFRSFSLIALLSLAACGNTTLDRGASGAGIGGSLGMIGSAVAGGAILPGLLVGSAVGAATGVLTTEEQINLGKPIWQQ